MSTLDRVVIPNSVPVGLSLGSGGSSAPGYSRYTPPNPASNPRLGVFNHVNQPTVPRSPGSGVVNPPAPSIAPSRVSPYRPVAESSPLMRNARPIPGMGSSGTAIPRSQIRTLNDFLADQARQAASPTVPAAPPPPPTSGVRGLGNRSPRRVGQLGGRALGVAGAASTAYSVGEIGQAVEDAILDSPLNWLPRPVTDFLRYSPNNNPFDPGNFLNAVPRAFGPPLLCQLFGICPTSPDEQTPGDREPAPPFYGGQQPGVAYSVRVQWETFNMSDDAPFSSGDTNWQSGTTGFRIWGAISNIYTPKKEDVISRANSIFVVQAASATDQTRVERTILSSSDTLRYRVIRGIQIQRLDLQPDTGGNPAALPNAPRQPALSPARAPSPYVSPSRQPSPGGSTPTGTPTTAPPSPISPGNLSPSSSPDPLTPIPLSTPNTLSPSTSPGGQPSTNPNSSPEGNLNPFSPTLIGAIPLVGGLAVGAGIVSGIIPSGLGTRTAARGNRPRNPSTDPTPTPPAVSPSTGTTPNLTCRFRTNEIDRNYTSIEENQRTIIGLQTFMTGQMQTINNKLGAQVPGGIGGLLTVVGQTVDKIQELGKKTWNFLQIDRVLAILTWIGVLHNAYMLSNSITQTLFETIGQVLNVFGIEDADGNSLPVGEIVGEWTENFMKAIIGEETLDGMKEGWKRANRIYQAAANIVFTIQSMIYSLVEILEVISNYTGRIGNALLRSGTILANSFNWMNPAANYLNNRFFRTLYRVEDMVETISMVADEVLNIQESGERLYDQTQEFNEAFRGGVDFVTELESVSAGNSKRPTMVITPDNELRAETDS